jgi:hypothetical protein
VTQQDAENAVTIAADLVRESAVQILDTNSRLAEIETVTVNVVDRNQLICEVRVKSGRTLPYPVEETRHLVQFFGTQPRRDDADRLAAIPGDYTARLLLVRRSIPDGSLPLLAPLADDYVDHLEEYTRPKAQQAGKRGLIVSGAFPAGCSAKEQQDIVDAVRAFVRRVFERGGTVIFGSHPTFMPLIVESAKEMRPNEMEDAVRLYYSTKARDYQQYEGVGTATPVEGSEDRNVSLTAMRSAMIADENAVGLVAIGGMLDNRPGIKPGVLEETEMARQKGLPVMLIGAVRGMSAELAVKAASDDWRDAPNDFSREENERLRTSLDFAGLASTFLRKLGI